MPSGSPQAMFPPPTRRRILLIGGSLLVTTGLMASCGGEGGSGTPTATTPSIGLTSEPTPSSALPRELQGSVVVHFRSADGVDLEGRMFGTGTVGVVLAHIADPQRFMAGKGAVESGYDPTADARSMYRSSVRPKELVVVPSPLPGNALLLEPTARRALLRFLAEYR
jgi:hypothetical protein